jgi:hypothetical protein
MLLVLEELGDFFKGWSGFDICTGNDVFEHK